MGPRSRPALVIIGLLLAASPAAAMHLADGILPLSWAGLWTLLMLPFVAVAALRLRRRELDDPLYRPLVAMVAASVFLISCMPIPVPLTGTCSHPCGTGLAAILVGPWMTVLITLVALLLQALLLAHGGLTTLGADVMSMGVAGAFVGWLSFAAARRLGAPLAAAAFAGGLMSDWATYATTSLELATALHGSGSVGALFTKVLLAFVPTQLPLGLFEGVLAAGAVGFLFRRRRELLVRLALVPA